MLKSPAALDLFLLGSDPSLINGFSVSSVTEAKVCNINLSSYFGGLYNKTIFAKGICAIRSTVLIINKRAKSNTIRMKDTI